MSFVSPVFILFLAGVLVGVRLLSPERRGWILLPASWLFYAFHHVALLPLLLLATLVSFGCARAMAGSSDRRKKRCFLLLGSTVCLGMLFVFKYLDFAVGSVSFWLEKIGVRTDFAGFHLLLPMGISFYTFQTMSYMIDVYRGTVPAEERFDRYALFVSFFPQLVAGPIERPGDLLPQLAAPKNADPSMVGEGWMLMLRGYAKKVMIADSLAPLVDQAYHAPAQAGGAALMLATALFAVQIYCDFSGYTDIALGCARLLGIRLSENFRRPYAAVTIRDFWRRWHISLTRWFTDYLYIPLGGSRCGKARHCVNILIVFAVSGLWHGADVTFVIWGALHGLYLAAETLMDRPVRFTKLRHAVTLLLVGFAWIFFRADGWGNAVEVLQTMFSRFQPQAALSGMGMTGTTLLLTVLLLLLLPMLERLPVLNDPAHGTEHVLLYFLLITALLLCRLMLVHGGGVSAFIYFQF